MTDVRKTESTDGPKAKTLKLNKETIKDLDAPGGEKIKGGSNAACLLTKTKPAGH
jgi:hypothetical protein